MPLALQSLPASPWKLHDASDFGLAASPISLAKSTFCKARVQRGGSGVRCSAEEGEASVTDNAGAKGPSHESWLQIESLADRYAGWSSDEEQSNGDNLAGWLKIGGALFLAIGFALGTRSMYTRKGIINKVAIPAPVKEHIISNKSVHFQADHDSMDNGIKGDNQEGTQNHEKESPLGNSTSNLQHKETATATLRTTLGRVVVPAPVDHMQEQAVAALQALKVIEVGVEPGAICTRREYARWLIAASGTLTRSPARKVFPAMYIENVSELAFGDVSPEDPDFPCIQGLAEAGLISSKLTERDKLESSESHVPPDESKDILFLPESPLSRQDLVSWKLALERQFTPAVNKEVLQSKAGFIDIKKIHQDAWPALLADLAAGERSIVALAFGHTRRFQPDKPVTKAQAAIALSTGEAADIVSEELARLEAESIAEAAVTAEMALESKAQLEVAAAFNRLLEEEKAKKEAAEQLAELTLVELKRLKAERDEEKYAILRERAAVESEREFLSRLRQEIEEKSEFLANAKVEVAFQRERIEKLFAEAEAERVTLANLQTELEVEKKALTMARLWAEEEARKAYSHAKVLEAARKRWEDQGVRVQVDKDLDELNIPAISWRYSDVFQEQSSLMTGLLTKSRNLRWEVMEVAARILHTIEMAVNQFRHEAIESLREVGKKAAEVKDGTTSAVVKTAENMQQSIYSSTSSVSSGLRERTRRVVDECKGGAEKLAQKFKTT